MSKKIITSIATIACVLSVAAIAGVANAAVQGCTITSFDRNLKMGMTGDDVKCLQIILNSDSDTQLATEGAGSPGNETSYFGPLTRAAVVKFQEKYASEILASYGLTKGTGFVGPTTRAKLNSILSGGSSGVSCSDITNAVQCVQANCSWDAANNTCSSPTGEEEKEVNCSEITDAVQCVQANCSWEAANNTCSSPTGEEEKEVNCSEITDAVQCVQANCSWDATNNTCSSPTGEQTSEGLTVSLASDTPAGVVLTSQGKAPLAKFSFTNGETEEVKVTGVELTRIGVCGDDTVETVYLYEGNTRLDDSSFASGKATFTNSDGLFTIAPGKTVVITVRGDVASGVSYAGQTIGVSLASASAITTDASEVKGDFPLNGNIMSVVNSGSLLASASIGTSSIADTTVMPGETEVEVWKGTITPSGNDVLLKYIQFRQKGNIALGDLKNFKLYIEGSQVGDVTQMSSDYSVAFDLSDSPVTLETGEKTVKLVADIVGGSDRNAQFYLSGDDLLLEDSQYHVLLDLGTTQYTCDQINISGGSLSVTVSTDSPASVPTTTDAVIAKFDLKGYGEKIKVKKITLSASPIRNGVIIYKDGSALNSSTTVNSTGTEINITDFYIQPGEVVTLVVKADMSSASTGTANFTLSKVTGTSKSYSSDRDFFSGTATAHFDVLAVTFNIRFANAPDAFLTSVNESPVVAQYKFTSQGTDVTLKKVYLEASTTDAWNVVTAYKLKIGDTTYTADEDESTAATSTFVLNKVISGGSTVMADVIAELRSVSSATDGTNIATKITKYVYERDGREYTVTGTVGPSKEVYAYRSVPEIEVLSTGENPSVTQGPNTDVTLYKWKVTAVGNDLKVSTTTLYVNKSGSSASTTLSNIELLLNGSLVDSSKYNIATSSDLASPTVTTSTIVITPESGYEDLFEISAAGNSLTFEVRADVNFAASGAYVKTNLLGDSSATTTGANFVWNDKVTETATNASGYLVKGLPSSGTDPYLVKYYSH